LRVLGIDRPNNTLVSARTSIRVRGCHK
jgi:hypothetical protein